MTADDRLDSWKEIAAYLKRDVTTVQRWEKREGMPVRRHLHDKLGSVYAFRSELDAWALSRNLRASDPIAPDTARDSPGNDLETRPDATAASAVPARRRLRLAALVAVAAVLGLVVTEWWHLERTDSFWRNPIDGARFQTMTNFGGVAEAASLSRDGRFVAFLSDRDGHMDVWLTQIGTNDLRNLTHGQVTGLVNPSLRTLGFSPDGSLVTFWARGAADSGAISIWAVPLLGGSPRIYLEGAAEYDWSRDGSRLVYHTPGPGDPMFVRNAGGQAAAGPIFSVAEGSHAHFPTWSPDGAFIYFLQGPLDHEAFDARDIWRIKPTGGQPERIALLSGRVSYPVMLNDRTLMYLGADPDGSGPSLYGLDISHRMPHRVSTGPDKYTSLAASADGRRLVATLAGQNGTLWRLPLGESPVGSETATPVSLNTGTGFSPRYGPGYLVYVSSKGTGDGLWKLVGSEATVIWSATDARVIGGPDVAPDGKRLALSVQQDDKTLLYVINADGSNARVLAGSLALRGAPAWSPDGQSITSAVEVNGTPRLYRLALDGRGTRLVPDYSVDPAWSPTGDVLLYSGPDVGTTFPVKAVTNAGGRYPLPRVVLTRGARRLRFLPGRRTIVVMRGDLDHKDLWAIDLDTGAERQLTRLAPDFKIRDFDVSPDGGELILERVQEHSDIVLIDLARRE